MRIAIDISAVVYETGVSHSTAKLVKTLLETDKENEYILFGGSLRRLSDLYNFTSSFKGNFTTKFLPIPPTLADILWNRLKFPKLEKVVGAHDVFHSSDWSQPGSDSFKITTIHDLAPIKFLKEHHPKIVSTHKRRLERVKEIVDRVIVPSEATAEDVTAFGIAKEKVRIIPWAPVFSAAGESSIESIKKRLNIGGKYLLSVGVNPRKNTQRIIEAFHLAKAGEDIKLVLVGTPSNIKLEEERGIRIVGHTTDEELSALYSGAEALVYPSLYEGFGIPILDAMNCGVPVVTSNLSSMPEVSGDAAVLVDPYSVDSIVEGIKTALGQKKTLVKKGKAHVAKFSWEKTARRTLEVYNESL